MPQYLSSEPTVSILHALGDALDLVDIGILLLDPEFRVRYMNHRLVEMFSLPPAIVASGVTYRDFLDHVGATGWFVVDPCDLPQFLDGREAAVRAGPVPPSWVTLSRGRRLLFCCVVCHDGGRILTYADLGEEMAREVSEAVEAGCAEMRFQNETLEGQAAYLASLAEATDESARAVEVARLELEEKIAEQRQLEAELRQLANIDGLTGALNRVTFMARAQQVLEQGRSLVALMLDIDHFKAINDQYGHAAGDHALRRFVAIIQKEIRERDLLGRLGGEEFAVVLPIGSPREAAAVAERLRGRIAEAPLTFGGIQFAMTVSIGIAMQRPEDCKIDEVIARADAALYQAKAAGRDRVIMAETVAAE